MKLTKIERQIRKGLKSALEAKGGELFSFADEGLTVLVVPAAGGLSDFAHVCIAQCDMLTDEFNRKRGEYIALERWDCMQWLSVPYAYRDNEEIAEGVLGLLVG